MHSGKDVSDGKVEATSFYLCGQCVLIAWGIANSKVVKWNYQEITII